MLWPYNIMSGIIYGVQDIDETNLLSPNTNNLSLELRNPWAFPLKKKKRTEQNNKSFQVSLTIPVGTLLLSLIKQEAYRRRI